MGVPLSFQIDPSLAQIDPGIAVGCILRRLVVRLMLFVFPMRRLDLLRSRMPPPAECRSGFLCR